MTSIEADCYPRHFRLLMRTSMNTSNVQKTNVDLFLIGLIALLLAFTYYSNHAKHGMEPKVKPIGTAMKW